MIFGQSFSILHLEDTQKSTLAQGHRDHLGQLPNMGVGAVATTSTVHNRASSYTGGITGYVLVVAILAAAGGMMFGSVIRMTVHGPE